jgi:hypothetical protein
MASIKMAVAQCKWKWSLLDGNETKAQPEIKSHADRCGQIETPQPFLMTAIEVVNMTKPETNSFSPEASVEPKIVTGWQRIRRNIYSRSLLRYLKQRASPIHLLLMATGSTNQTTQSSLDGNN